MFDTSTASIDEFIFASKTRNDPVGKQRHVIDAFRTVAWFNLLRTCCGATSTYQMDQLLEKSISQDGGEERDYKNKWRSYRVGRHTPSAKLVEMIDAKYPGSRAVLNHVIWNTLRLDRPITSHADSWLNELHPEIQRIVLRRGAAFSIGKTIHLPLNRTRLSMLERRAGFDALACLIMLLRMEAETGDTSSAQSLGQHLCRMLIILGPMLVAAGVASPLAQFFEQVILPISSHHGLHYRFWGKGYLSAVRRLTFAANCLEGDENRQFTTSERIALRINILEGQRGDLLCDAFTLQLPHEHSAPQRQASGPPHH